MSATSRTSTISPHMSPMTKATHSLQSMGLSRQLLTPEEPLLDNFSSTLPPLKSTNAPPSPVSPDFHSVERGTDGSFSSHDPPLYPDHNRVGMIEKPLFDDSFANRNSSSTPSPVSRHITPIASPSRRDGPHLTPVQRYNQDAMGWWRHCMDDIDSRRRTPFLPPPQYQTQSRDTHSTEMLHRLDSVIGETARVHKPRTASRPLHQKSKSIPTEPVSPPQRATETPAKRTHRRKHTTPDPAGVTSADAKPRTRQPATKKKDGPAADAWFEVDDVCPPVSSLRTSSVGLIVPEWKNAGNSKPLDLTNDPDAKHLDPAELDLASVLRLQCNLYLLCKRRIFAAKLQWLKDVKAGKEIKGDFNKTAAQNVCTIDVNKVSKLWIAFHRVGWFDEHWYQQWL